MVPDKDAEKKCRNVDSLGDGNPCTQGCKTHRAKPDIVTRDEKKERCVRSC